MANIQIKFKNGEIKKFPHEGRPGGSFTKTIRYEGGFAIIEDEHYNTFSYPASDIEEVKTTPNWG